jgi:hypothetical protein
VRRQVTYACDMGNETFVSSLFDVFLNTAPLSLVDYWYVASS